MTPNRNTIIFDLDGTLLDTLDDLTDSINHVMTQHHFPLHSREHVQQMVGNGIYNLFSQAIPDGSHNPDYDLCIQEFQAYYSTHAQIKTAPFPGILKLLSDLKEEGYALGVVSNKFDSAVKKLCKNYFGDIISVAIGQSQQLARKPAPDMVLEAIRQLDATQDTCIYVGDSDVDIETAKNSYIPCISVTWGFRSEAFLLAHSATFIASDSNALYKHIRALSG